MVGAHCSIKDINNVNVALINTSYIAIMYITAYIHLKSLTYIVRTMKKQYTVDILEFIIGLHQTKAQ